MTTFPAAGYISSGARTEAEVKTAFEDWLAATKQLPGGLAASTLTLASDQVTPTRALHFVDTEVAASTDNLAQLLTTSLPDGSTVFLSTVSSARTVVVKHAAGGTGQVSLSNSADFAMTDSSMGLLLKRVGTTWVEIGRFYGNASAAHRAYYGAAGLGQNTFTGRQEWDKGADIASAATLTLGTDGNYFDVTGTATVTAISSAPVGTRVLLQFDASLQITHNATSLILPSGQNIQTQAGGMLEFVSEGAGNWRLNSGGSFGVGIFERSATQVTVGNSIAETTIVFKGIPGGILGVQRRARISLIGSISTGTDGASGASPGTVFLTFRMYYGGTLIAVATVNAAYIWTDGGTFQAAIPIGTAFRLEGTIEAVGATNAQNGTFDWSCAVHKIAQPAHTPGLIVPVVGACVTNGPGPASVDSTIAQGMTISAQWSVAATNYTVTLRHLTLFAE